MTDETAEPRDLERELTETYPDLALLLRRTAQMHAWLPSSVGETVLRRLAGAVAEVLARRLDPAAAAAFMADVMTETQAWLATMREARGRSGTREG